MTTTQMTGADALHGRILALGGAADRMPAAALAGELDALRRIAASSGMLPAVMVIHAIDSALARGERGPMVHAWLAILGDTIASGRSDPVAHETFAAACSVRLAGG